MSVLDSFLSKKDNAEIKKINKIVDKIEAIEEEISSLSDEDLRNKTQLFKDRLGSLTLVIEDLLFKGLKSLNFFVKF